MIYVGIDFSLNSPGMVIKLESGYEWFTFSNNLKIDNKPFLHHKQLQQLKNVFVLNYNRQIDRDDYSINEILKLDNANFISDLIIENIVFSFNRHKAESEYRIGIEGYSYGSKGNSLIDIITYTSILRNAIHNNFINTKMSVHTPSSVKMFAGKGNYSKIEMLTAFLDNVLEDPILPFDNVYNYIKKNYKEILIKDKIKAPFTDLIDAYFISNIIIEP